MHGGLPCGAQRRPLLNSRRRNLSLSSYVTLKGPPCKLASGGLGYPYPRKGFQPQAAHAHGHSAELVQSGSTTSFSGPSASLLSYLRLGSHISTAADAASVPQHGDTPAHATRATASRALLRSLRAVSDHLGSSLEQFVFDGAAESMPNWDPSQMAGVLMALGLLHRRPDEAWLTRFWSVSLAKLPACSTTDLAMASLGVSELQLQPPHSWTEALLSATMAAAEGGPASGASQSVIGTTNTSIPGPFTIPEVTASVSHRDGTIHHSSVEDGPAAQAQRIHGTSMCDTADPYDSTEGAGTGGSSSSSDSGFSGMLLLEPLQALWAGVQSAAAAVSGAWRHSQCSNELVTVVYNLTAAGVHLERAWMRRFMEAMRPRLLHLSGDDLHCLLLVAADEAGINSSSSSSGYGDGDVADVELSPQWQAALFARMDGVNWALQGSHLVGCLASITRLGLRPPPPWVRRQLLRLQLSLHLLPTSVLVQLGDLLPSLPLYDVPTAAAPLAETVSCSGGAPYWPSASPWRRSATSPSWMPAAAWRDSGCVASWLTDYRAAVADRRHDMTPGELLSVMTGVAAAMASSRLSPAGDPAAAVPSAPLPVTMVTARSSAGVSTVVASPGRSASGLVSEPGLAGSRNERGSSDDGARMPYDEWRRLMVDAVADRLPELTVAELCEVWQVLAEAETGLQEQQQQRVQQLQLLQQTGQQQQHERQGLAVEEDTAIATTASEDLGSLRRLVATRLADHPGPLSTADVAPVLSSLAASEQPLPAATLGALLAASQPLLPDLTPGELVTVVLSLVRLSYKPNLAWQTAFCAASRRRLTRMTPGQRCSLLVASAGLGLYLPDPWVMEFLAVSELSLDEQLDGTQLANMLWAVSCVTSEPAMSWLVLWECASIPRLPELGPNMLAVVLKAMCTLHYRPSEAWQHAFFAALKRRLFAAGAAPLTWRQADADGAEAGSECSGFDAPLSSPSAAAAASDGRSSDSEVLSNSWKLVPTEEGLEAPTAPPHSTSVPADSNAQPAAMTATPGPLAAAPRYPELAATITAKNTTTITAAAVTPAMAAASLDMLSPTVTPEALNSLIYSLASLELTPPPGWLDELMDAVRCKLSLLSSLDLSVVLAYLVAQKHRPSDEWWESFLEALEGRLAALSGPDLASLLIMLNGLKVSPPAQWLDAFCAAAEPRLPAFQATHLLQVLSCLHLFRHRPGQDWMASFAAAVESQLPRFSPTELARLLMLLNHLNQRPPAAFMARFFELSRPGLGQLDSQELVNVAWAVASCSTLQPDARWTEALMQAARPRLAALQQPNLRVLVAAVGQMQRGSPLVSGFDFLAFAREFLVL